MADKKDVMVHVRNRSDSIVVYAIPELNVRREFAKGETKVLPLSELEALSYRPGGGYLLQHMLFVQEENAVQQMPISVEPEYYLDDQGVIKLLNGMDNLAEFLDCLDFAPDGVKDLIKKYAVELPVNDTRKRDAIKKKLNFDVDRAILNLQLVKEEEERERANNGEAVEEPPTRRVQKKDNVTLAAGRRTTPNYKIVN